MPIKISKEKTHKSEELYFQALESDNTHECRKLLIKAININPENVEALVCLADFEDDVEKAIENYNQIISISIKNFGEQFFIENQGVFWLNHETRPYMRAMVGLGACYVSLAEFSKAVTVYEQMLELNPNDNQGIRYLLSSLYLEMSQYDNFEKLDKQFEDDCFAVAMFNRTLNDFIKQGISKESNKLLTKAHKQNKYVIDLLIGKRQVPKNTEIPDYISLGGEDEAISYALENKPLWQKTDQAVSWLQSFTAKK